MSSIATHVFRSPSPEAGMPRAVSSELPTIRPAVTRSFTLPPTPR